jgi:hypothetical protein
MSLVKLTQKGRDLLVNTDHVAIVSGDQLVNTTNVTLVNGVNIQVDGGLQEIANKLSTDKRIMIE